MYEDIDLRYYPERIIKGEKIKNISLLKFKKCYMSNHYFNNYLNLINYDKHSNFTTFDVVNKIYEDIILPDNLNDDKLIAFKPNSWKDKYQLYYDNNNKQS